MGLYAKLVPIGIGLALSATSFLLGLVYAQVPYTYFTLFSEPQPVDFDESLAHYQRWYRLPILGYIPLFIVTLLGFTGLLIVLYKPGANLKLYDYTSLGLYFFGVCVAITNIKTGIAAAAYGTWGEVDMPTGINVIGASQCMMVFFLLGVLVLQAGRYYQIIEDENSEIEYQQRLKEFEKQERERQEEEEKEAEKQAKKDARNEKKYGHVKPEEAQADGKAKASGVDEGEVKQRKKN
ncbi:Shr3 protein [Saccharomycopsis crataegensis]|uniref:Shr3 protein n=1 Tax=Saccharomycopsis crataegensis TaxID=43959 RepID=A0AAV5QPX8_9ASCO|nr:Shr3 protein [Saccharomycopsis crataegensis]